MATTTTTATTTATSSSSSSLRLLTNPNGNSLLPAHQRKLRHIEIILARNLTLPFLSPPTPVFSEGHVNDSEDASATLAITTSRSDLGAGSNLRDHWSSASPRPLSPFRSTPSEVKANLRIDAWNNVCANSSNLINALNPNSNSSTNANNSNNASGSDLPGRVMVPLNDGSADRERMQPDWLRPGPVPVSRVGAGNSRNSGPMSRWSTSSQLLLLEKYASHALGHQDDLLDSYFILQEIPNEGDQAVSDGDEGAGKDEPFYISEITTGSVNPFWHWLEDTMKPQFQQISMFKLQVFARSTKYRTDNPQENQRTSTFEMILSLTIDLTKLVFVGSDLADIERSFPSNTLLFKLHDGYYIAEIQAAGDHFNEEDPLPFVKVDASRVKNSYRFDNITRILNLQDEISSAEEEIRNAVDVTTSLYEERRGAYELMAQVLDFRGRISLIETEIMKKTQEIQSTRSKIEEAKEGSEKKRLRLVESVSDRELTRQTVFFEHVEYMRQKNDCSRTVKAVNRHQQALLGELRNIYPLSQVFADPFQCAIRGLRLPNSEFSGTDDEKISTALGYTSHLVIMIARYLEVPLRYPINSMSSRSMILDRVSKHFSGFREFPLYMRGVERPRFEYGVFLLNKDIEQLMNHVGLSVTNLRNTLPNLRHLLETVERMEDFDDDDEDFDGLEAVQTEVATQAQIHIPALDLSQSITSETTRKPNSMASSSLVDNQSSTESPAKSEFEVRVVERVPLKDPDEEMSLGIDSVDVDGERMGNGFREGVHLDDIAEMPAEFVEKPVEACEEEFESGNDQGGHLDDFVRDDKRVSVDGSGKFSIDSESPDHTQPNPKAPIPNNETSPTTTSTPNGTTSNQTPSPVSSPTSLFRPVKEVQMWGISTADSIFSGASAAFGWGSAFLGVGRPRGSVSSQGNTPTPVQAQSSNESFTDAMETS
ncbi:hypothetical protein HDU76_000510 [Blyttiomyces sp. JEL0837]|nr:hypothetical protein HDU76_000510 [Blyttiomyces sp. JEL0837]